MSKTIRVDDHVYNALQDKAGATKKPFVSINSVLRDLLGLDVHRPDIKGPTECDAHEVLRELENQIRNRGMA